MCIRDRRKQGIVPDPPKPAWDLADMPVVKAFTVRYPSAGAASVQKFYDESARNERYYTSWMARAREGDVEAAQRIQAAGGPGFLLKMNGFKDAMSKHAQLIRA